MLIRHTTLALCLSLAFTTGVAQTSNSSPCDPALEILAVDANRYQERDQNADSRRCEGLYLQDVASSAIKLTSLTTTYEPFTTAQTITLAWDENLQPEEPFLHIRAESQVFKLYYRMDTQVDVDDHTFNWPTTSLAALSLSKSDVGVVAWLPVALSGVDQDVVERDVYIPLRVTQDNPPENKGYQVVIMPTSELTEVRYYVAAEQDGYRGPDVLPEKALGYGYYPNGRPVSFDFTLDNQPAGVYYLEIEAERATANDSRLEIWFYHAGN